MILIRLPPKKARTNHLKTQPIIPYFSDPGLFRIRVSTLYFLFVAQDCNFRLIHRNIGTVGKDPILNDGCGYFVNHEKYTKFLSGHVTEEEISSCSGFQALFPANRK
jgi:hypothetical protein